MKRGAIGLVIMMTVGLLLGGLVGYFAPSPARSEFVPAAAPVQASPIRVSYSGTGTFRVPGQVAPGTYMVTAGAGDFGCYWERLRRLDKDPKSVLSHGQATRGGYGRLVVTAADQGVRFVGDCVWVGI